MPGVGLQLPAPLSSLSALALKFLIGTFPVPPFLLPIYQAAGIDYGVPWEVLASINEVETDYGRDLSTSSAGAVGWMQFLPSTWERYGINADGGAGANPYDPIDAIFAAARYLHAAGAEANLSGAIFAYNHAGWYVNSVELRANVLQLLPRGLIDGLTGLMQASFPVAGHLGRYATVAPTLVRLAGQPAVALGGPSGAPVIAVADARVVAIGDDATRGRYVTIEDSYGDRFTYAHLGSVPSLYPVLTPRVEPATRLAGELGLRPAPPRGTAIPAATSSTTRRSTPASTAAGGGRGGGPGAASPTLASAPSSTTAVKERLFAHPSRTASYASGGELQLQSSLRSYAAASDLQVGGSGPSDYFSETARLKLGAFTLAPLTAGATVVAGTILGRIAPAAHGASGVVLQIRPAGARAPVDPRPVVAGWELLGRLTAGRPALAGTGQSGAFGSRNPSLGQLLLSSKRGLAQAVLADPRLTISRCDRQAVQAGLVDWRVLAVIEYLSYSGLAPTISGLVCGQPGIPSQTGTRVEISNLDGIPVAGNEQDGGVVDLAIRALLALQGPLRASRIVSLRSYPWQATTIALPDHAATLEVDFSTPGSAASAGAGLDTAQWQRLIERLTQLGAPAGGSAAASPPAPATPPTATPPTVTTPTVTTPTVTTPTVTTPTVTTPTVTTPTVTTPMPTVTTPPVTAPTVTTPAVTTPTVTAPAVTTPTVTKPTATKPARSNRIAKHATGKASSASPLVGLTAPPSPLTVSTNDTFVATASAVAPQTIAQVDFQYSPAGAGSWKTFACFSTTNPGCGATQFGNSYSGTLDTTQLGNGVYDFQAVAVDSANSTSTSVTASDITVVNNATYVGLTSPGSPLSGTTNLTGTVQAGGSTPATISFEICPTSKDCPANPASWQTLATVPAQVDPFTGNATAQYSLDTAPPNLADGSYDLGVTAADATGDPFQGGAVSGLVVDNTQPTVTLQAPGPLSGPAATLQATASDCGSGLDDVKFEVAPAGTNNWTGVGSDSAPAASPCPGSSTYSVSFDSRQFRDGSYDIRAEATDNAGNTSQPAIATGVAIANPGSQPFGALSITNYTAPAFNITLLGELPGSQHETWAIGQTNAPPPAALVQKYSNPAYPPYNNQGNGQVVLLEYTDATGWQIADVLLDQNGNPYPLPPAGNSLQVTGNMTASGEAWIVVHENVKSAGVNNVFHRLPGGPFQLDPTATATLQPLLRGSLSLRLHQAADGTVAGVLVSSQAPTGSQQVNSTNGPVTITTQLQYGQLVGGVWTLPSQATTLPGTYTAPAGVSRVSLSAADVTGSGTGWAAFQQSGSPGGPMILARFDPSGWTLLPETGLDALDLTGPFATGSPQFPTGSFGVTPLALRADSTSVWISARGPQGQVFARYDDASGRVVDSWCTTSAPVVSPGCARSWSPPGQPAAVPDAVFTAPDGSPVADASVRDFIDVYYHGAWTAIAAPGFTNPGASVFVDPTDGWLAGQNTLALVSATPPPAPLTSWPEANRNPLLSVALPPGQSTTATPGALAVGLNGTALHYDTSAGWQVDATPPQAHHIALTGVGFAGPSSAFAVGQVGTILHWNGTSWSADRQSLSLTTATLNGVAFGSDGQGWAVGSNGTILHYDGTAWSPEQIDAQDADTDVTSVAVAGQYVYAIASGNLIVRNPSGTWQRAPASSLPAPAPPTGSLDLVSGLPDGGVAVAGKSLLMITDSASAPFTYAPESFNGIPVGLAAFRDASGALRAFVSVAPPVTTEAGPSGALGGFPAGDGDLLLLTGSGWDDLSHDLPASSAFTASGDGVVQPDPVLAVAASPDGTHAWAVGGYAGTHAADGIGTDQLLAARPAGWFTSSIWRYDTGGSATSPATTETPVSLPATPSNVSFAFFSSALCKFSCAQVQNAQPDVNLRAAATEIAAYAQQPGGPAFAMVGGNAHGSMGGATDPLDIANLPQLLSPLSGVPTYAAYGPLDTTSGSTIPALPWAEAFSGSPAPFGAAAAPAFITPRGSGDPTGPVNKYYAFDVRRNGGTLRVIVLDNSAGSLDASAPGQSAWLTNQLTQAQAAGLPIVVFAAEPLNTLDFGAASDGDAVAAQLAAAGVLAVFTTSGGSVGALQTQPDQVAQVPADAQPGAPQIPEYEGATMTYQQPSNNGVLWYDVSVNTATDQLTVNAIPVISSLALEPLNGLAANRSSTLSFQAIGRRPSATIATTPLDATFPGYDQYVNIPASTCSTCIGPSYSFTSSDRTVGNFVVPSSPGSPYPKLSASGKTSASAKSGLFCAFNAGTTIVSVTSGLLTASLPVTVSAGSGFGPPCGTVPGGTQFNTINVGGGLTFQQGSASTAPPGLQPQVNTPVTAVLPKIALPPLPAPPVLRPTLHRPPPTILPPVQQITPVFSPPPPPPVPVPPIVPPLIPAAITPVPPGGATVSAQAAARREEKARRHAQQSAYVIRPMGTSGSDWFFPAVGVVTVLAMLLLGAGARPGPRRKYAWADSRAPGSDLGRRRRR